MKYIIAKNLTKIRDNHKNFFACVFHEDVTEIRRILKAEDLPHSKQDAENVIEWFFIQ